MEEIVIKSGSSVYILNPDRAGLDEWAIGGKNVIYPKHENKSGKTRGGLFACFPFFGPAPDEIGDIPQHGYLRDLDFTIDRNNRTIGGWITRFRAEHEGAADYPHHVTIYVTYRLSPVSLEVTLEIRGHGDAKKIILSNPAFHPYFATEKVEDRVLSIDGLTHTPGPKSMIMEMPFTGHVSVKTDAGYFNITSSPKGSLCLWSDDGKYSCIEPVRSGDHRNMSSWGCGVKPGDKPVKIFSMRISPAEFRYSP